MHWTFGIQAVIVIGEGPIIVIITCLEIFIDKDHLSARLFIYIESYRLVLVFICSKRWRQTLNLLRHPQTDETIRLSAAMIQHPADDRQLSPERRLQQLRQQTIPHAWSILCIVYGFKTKHKFRLVLL